MQPPPAHYLSHLLQSVRADRRQKRREHHPVLVACPTCAKREPKERKRRLLSTAAPISVLAVHDFGFIGMQPQPDLDHPVCDRSPHLLSLLLANTMHDRIISKAFERDIRKVPGHPRIKRVMQKQVR